MFKDLYHGTAKFPNPRDVPEKKGSGQGLRTVCYFNILISMDGTDCEMLLW
jgi:hypothetical protein